MAVATYSPANPLAVSLATIPSKPSFGVEPVLKPLRIAANRGELPSLTATADPNSVRIESRKFYLLGRTDYAELRLSYVGSYVSTLNVETPCGNDQNVKVALEISGAPTPVVQLTFGGNLQGVIPNGSWDYQTDPIYPAQFGLAKFPSNMNFWVREERSVANGAFYTREIAPLVSNLVAGESTRRSDGLSAAQLLSSGALVTPAGGSLISRVYGPACILGRALDVNELALIGVGDSILSGKEDTAFPQGAYGIGGGGFLQRGLVSVNGGAIPLLQMAYFGTWAQQFAANMAGRRIYFKYGNILIGNYGTNAAATRTAAQEYADNQTIWSAARVEGIKRVEVLPITPKAASTDSWATVGNQTPVTGFATGGAYRDAFNTLLTGARNAGLVEGVIDINQDVADVAQPDRWKATGSAFGYATDSTHLSVLASTAAGARVQAKAATWNTL